MKLWIFSTLLFSFAINTSPAQANNQTGFDAKDNFDCANIKVEKMNLKFCAIDDREPVLGIDAEDDKNNKKKSKKEEELINKQRLGLYNKRKAELKKNQETITHINNGAFKKYESCSIEISENGKKKSYSNIEHKEIRCSPVERNGCLLDRPEDSFRFTGPKCHLMKNGERDCYFELRKAFMLGDRPSTSIHADSRKSCTCTREKCAHVITKIFKPDAKNYTKEEKAAILAETIKNFKAVAPGCTDVKVEDISVGESSRMDIAMSSVKCTIQQTHDIIYDQDCPSAEAPTVERVWVHNTNKRFVIATICLPSKAYMGPGSNSDDKKTGFGTFDENGKAIP